MNIFYLDVSGRRDWASIRNAKSILLADSNPIDTDVVFIHVTDLNNVLIDSSIGYRTVDWQALCRFRDRLITDGTIGQKNVRVVLYSGDAEVANATKVRIEQAFHDHNKQAIGIVGGVERGLSSDSLERKFGSLINSGQGKAEDFRSGVAELASAKLTDELIIALRLLWQTYVLAKTPTTEIPPRLRAVQGTLANCTFSKDYWLPVLKENKLDDRLTKCADQDLAAVVKSLNNQADWDNVNVPEHMMERYRQRWFEQLKNTAEGGTCR